MLVEAQGVIDESIPCNPSEYQQTEVIRKLRDLRPAHYLFKIENFSSLSSNSKADNYESSEFEVGGYKWKLSLYPKGNKKVNENEHISLYLVLSKSNAFTLHQEVNVYFKMFLYNQIQDKYLTVQDPKMEERRFRGVKTEWGFDQFVPLNLFNDTTNGYLIDDCCIFGAEVFVLEPVNKGECASVVKDLVNNTYTWNLQNFANMTLDFYKSPVFFIGGHRWTLCFYPKGIWEERGKCLSMFLELQDMSLECGHRLYVEHTMRVKDQLNGQHHEKTASQYFSTSSKAWGFPWLIPLSKLMNEAHGHITNDSVILEVEIRRMTVLKEFY